MRRKRGAVVCIGISSLLGFGTGEVSDVLNEELVRVVYQLLGVSHLRVEMAHDVQSVDRVRIGAVSLLLTDKVQEFTGTSDGLKLLVRRNPVRQFRVGAECFGHIGMGHLSSS